MNLAQNTSIHSHLRDEEALVVETAIRLAVDSILNVLYGVNSSRSREYQRMVADRDKEIQRLESKLREMEREALRRCAGCACTLLPGGERDQVVSPGTGEPQAGEERAGGGDAQPEAGQQHCELSLSCLFASPASHVPPLSQEVSAPLPFTPISRPDPDSADPSGASDASKKSPSPSSSGVAVKEEPCDIDSVLIKWEMSEERFREHRDGGLCWDEEQLERTDGMNCGEADAVAQRMTEADQMRNRKKRVSMAELPEEAQRLKRAAWRAASRRYYARKVARQQSLPARPGPFHHQTAPHYSSSSSSSTSHFLAFGNKRKRAPISTLPQESQAQQREAWRASSKRYYYARKMALHEMGPSQYPLQHTEPPGEAQDGGDSYADSGGLGGILCT